MAGKESMNSSLRVVRALKKNNSMNISPLELEVYKNLLSEVAEETGSTLSRTAFSPNIKERRDYSCAIFDGNGELTAQALHIPVHLGSIPHSVRHAIPSINLRSGDVAVLSDRRELPPYGLGARDETG
jgi:N-methylhydantoinase B